MIRPELIAHYQAAKETASADLEYGGDYTLLALLDEIVILAGDLLRREHENNRLRVELAEAKDYNSTQNRNMWFEECEKLQARIAELEKVNLSYFQSLTFLKYSNHADPWVKDYVINALAMLKGGRVKTAKIIGIILAVILVLPTWFVMLFLFYVYYKAHWF